MSCASFVRFIPSYLMFVDASVFGILLKFSPSNCLLEQCILATLYILWGFPDRVMPSENSTVLCLSSNSFFFLTLTVLVKISSKR